MMGSPDSRWFKKGRVEMNGAESLVRTLVGAGVEACFMNPGTSEIHFVQTLDRVREMRGVPVLFEGVASGAADGYARMTGKPACALFHLGPGLVERTGQPAQCMPRPGALG